MKKLYLVAIMAFVCLFANAQQKLTLSTAAGTDLQNYTGKVCDVTSNRVVFTGWNTISLPFSLSESELNNIFGEDCRLEKLVGVESAGGALVLNFQDCKAQGLQANVPYILHYTGVNTSKKIVKQTLVEAGTSALSFDVDGVTVTMKGLDKQMASDGLYGILAKDNAEAQFVSVGNVANGFHATRCCISISNGNTAILKTNHLAAGEVTSIHAVAKANEKVDVYNVSGIKVADNVNGLQPGIYIVKGRKVLVK